MAFTPVSILGSGTGLKNGECSDGRVTPFALAPATASGACVPSQNRQSGTFSLVRPYSAKSSAPMMGSRVNTLAAPRVASKICRTSAHNSGWLYNAGV
jgi:hypothetical protein